MERESLLPSHSQHLGSDTTKSNCCTNSAVWGLTAGKLLASMGQIFFSYVAFGEAYGITIPIIASVAIVFTVASGVETAVSRIPAIKKAARGRVGSYEDLTKLAGPEYSKNQLRFIQAFKWTAYFSMWTSAIAAALAAYLGIVTLVIRPYLWVTGQDEVSEHVSIPSALEWSADIFAFYPAICALVSFYAYSSSKAVKASDEIAQALVNWWDGNVSLWNKSVRNAAILCIFIVIANGGNGYFFLKNALEKFLLTKYLLKWDILTKSAIRYISYVSLVPSTITFLTTRIYEVYKLVKGDLKIKKKMTPSYINTRYGLLFIGLIVISAMELISTLIGSNISSIELIKDISSEFVSGGFNIPSLYKEGEIWQFVVSQILLVLLLNIEWVINQFAFTVAPVFDDLTNWVMPKGEESDNEEDDPRLLDKSGEDYDHLPNIQKASGSHNDCCWLPSSLWRKKTGVREPLVEQQDESNGRYLRYSGSSLQE